MSQNTTNEQVGLDAFRSNTTTTEGDENAPTVENDSAPEANESPSDSTIEQASEGDREQDSESEELEQIELSTVNLWDTENPTDIDGATVLDPMSPDFRSLTGSTGIYEHRVRLVVDGVDEYLEANECREIEVPSYYSEFDNFMPVITKRTAASNDGALGISGPDLENIIRYIAGKGGFSSTDLSVFVGAPHHFLVTYDAESFLVFVKDISYPEDADYTPETQMVRDFEVPEEDPTVAAGLEPFIDAVETHHDITIIDHQELRSGYHRFDVADEDTEYLQIKGNHLERIAKSTESVDDITGEFEVETEFGEVYSGEVTADDIEYEIGEEVRDRHVVGYTKSISDPRTSSKASMSGRLKVSVNTFCLLRRTDIDSDYIRFEVRSQTDTVARFKPQEKDYDPINDPLS